MRAMAFVRQAFSFCASSIRAGSRVERCSAANHAHAMSNTTAIPARIGRDGRFLSRRDVAMVRIADTRSFYRTVYVPAGTYDTPTFIPNRWTSDQIANAPRSGAIRHHV